MEDRWQDLGATLEFPHLRIYLTGSVCLEVERRFVPEHEFPGRQGRLVFAYLVCQRMRPVPHDELAEVLWPQAPPTAWEAALSALVSKLRRLCQGAGVPPGVASIMSQPGRYQMRLAPSVWIDTEAATLALDEAEGALRGNDILRAWGQANVAAVITRRPFLLGEESDWVGIQRRTLRELRVRALDALSDISLHNGETALAVQYADEVVGLEPFRETGYQRLMHVHVTLGNRAEALRVYERCRMLLKDELGTSPAPELQRFYQDLLRTA